MAVLLRRKNWGLQKPQAGAQINWGHPLAAGLVVAVPAVEGGGAAVELARRVPVIVHGGTPTWRPTRAGMSLTALAVSDYWEIGTEGTNLTLPTASCTVVLAKQRFGSLLASAAFGIESATTSVRLGAHVPFSDGVVYWDFGGASGNNRVSVSGLTFGDDTWAFRAGTLGTSIWQNGVQRASSATAITRSASTSKFHLNFGQVTNGDTARHAYFYVWSRELSQTDIQWLNAEPYAFLQPQAPARRYWVPPTIGTAQALAGTTAGTSGASGSLRVTHSLTGSTNGVSTTSGGLRETVALAGTTAGVSTDTASLKVAHSLAGSTSGISTDTAAVKVAHSLTGSTTGTSGLAGGIVEADHLGGTINGVGNATGGLNVAHALNGTTSGTSTAGPAAMRCARALTGTTSGQATCSASLRRSLAFAGTSSGISTTSGVVRLRLALAGTTHGISTLTGGLNFFLPDLNPLHFTYQEPRFAVTYTESSTIEHREPTTSFVYQEH